MATHSSVLAWRIPGTGEPGGLSSLGSYGVGHPGGGHGNPLQHSCLDNPMDRGTWRATVHRITKNRTQRKELGTHAPVYCSMSSSNCCFLTCIQISQEAGQVVCYSHLFQNFPQFVLIHTVKGFGIVNKAEIKDKGQKWYGPNRSRRY